MMRKKISLNHMNVENGCRLRIAKKEIKKLQQYAKNTLQKDKRINIRMSSKDLDQVQVIAVQEGIPYQTLVSSIIHKYVSGYLIERKKA